MGTGTAAPVARSTRSAVGLVDVAGPAPAGGDGPNAAGPRPISGSTVAAAPRITTTSAAAARRDMRRMASGTPRVGMALRERCGNHRSRIMAPMMVRLYDYDVPA